MPSVHSLPPELIGRIFLAFAEVTGESIFHDQLPFGDIDAVFIRPADILMRICHRWRAIALATPELWTFLFITKKPWDKADIKTYINRSHELPLRIYYRVLHLPLIHGTDSEKTQLRDVFNFLFRYRSNIAFLYLRTTLPHVQDIILEKFRTSAVHLPNLQSCILATESGEHARPINETNIAQEEDVMKTVYPQLHFMRLQRTSIWTIPIQFLSTLRRLELNNTPPRHGKYKFSPTMSNVYNLLSRCHLLEELIFEDIHIVWDVLPEGFTNSSTDPVVAQISLPHLNMLEWSSPFSKDANRFFYFFHVPALEKLDLWFDKTDHYAHGTPWRRLDPNYSQPLVFPALRELILQCYLNDQASNALKNFDFPILERLELSHMKRRTPLASLPSLLQLEAIFRDPRLPYLTHLTLSKHIIFQEHLCNCVDATLGYLPALTSLSIHGCTAVGTMLQGLQKLVGRVIRLPSGAMKSTHGVKLCPRLQALAFWGCDDLVHEDVFGVVKLRNGHVVRDDDRALATLPHHGHDPHNDGKGNESADNTVVGRKIKPLRSVGRQGRNGSSQPGATSAPTPILSTHTMSALTYTQESMQPASIVYLLIRNCPLIKYDTVKAIRDLGVDVDWVAPELVSSLP
ncbi:hypothetical protein AMATHDRAFT_6054 [Amanita thiersii Skay4041]|uniref:F-box domain-containing protein n=1 Tax=Amanita thiersii Skay4041 TaxID=703135 RepID=A0A2A9NIP1_9AGAR|nr:hypothetical protein AMATHDRAFT_6054 [Amanita thiersii Skay4041]